VTLERKKNYYKISIPLEKTTEDKAITSINQRGSWQGGEGNIDTTEFNSAKTRPMFYTETLKSTGISDMTEYFFCWRNLQEFPIKTSSNKEVVKKAEEPKKEVTKNTSPELMVGSYLVKSDKGVIYGMKVFSISQEGTIVMLYNQDGKPLFKQNETAVILDKKTAEGVGGYNILIIQPGANEFWLKIIKF
jgi:hypothetical protein